MRKLSRKVKHRPADIPEKTNRILYIILISLFLIAIRLWHLTVIQHDTRAEEAKKPRHRAVIEPAKRGTIRDRFNVPLAINKMQYHAAVCYAALREIPSVVWEGKVRRLKRRSYIRELSELLAKELKLDADRLEDLIHAKASLYASLPFVIKEDITEQEYYRLRMLEKDWLGVQAMRAPKRYYPKGRVAGDVVGYMGAISRPEYEAIIHEMRTLEAFLVAEERDEEPPMPSQMASSDDVRSRLQELEERAYTSRDSVGKTGIEGQFEEELRGFQGRKLYYSDAQGNFLKELPGTREPLPGKRLLLTLSSELQEYAEKLLAENESIREAKISLTTDGHKQTIVAPKQPWMKGGAIVALDPNTGEVIALASYPRFDPNDFIVAGQQLREKRSHIGRWLESLTYLGELWDQKRPLEREVHDKEFRDETVWLTWERYLEMILPPGHTTRVAFERITTIGEAVAFQRRPSSDLLTLDLCHLVAPEERFPKELLDKVGKQTLSRYRDLTAASVVVTEVAREMARDLFRDLDFREWRKANEKLFLKQKRLEEKLAEKYPRPYLDYLDALESEQFQAFWEERRADLLIAFLTGRGSRQDPYLDHFAAWHKELAQGAHQMLRWAPGYTKLQRSLVGLKPHLAIAYLKTMRSFDELRDPLQGRYRALRHDRGVQTEQNLAAAFYPKYGFGYGRSQAYRQAATQGSIFKLVTGYAALIQNDSLNPLEIVDRVHYEGGNCYVGYTQDGKSIPQLYKKGRLPKSSMANIGKLDILRALEVSSNPYFALLASDLLASPNDLGEAARQFSFGSRTGIDLPGELAGRVPTDLEQNRTGLYACAIGQHSLIVTPLQTAVMLSTIANGGNVLKPKIVRLMAGRDEVTPFSTEVKRELPLPNEIRSTLLKGMRRVVARGQSENLNGLLRHYKKHPEAVRDFISLGDKLLGKSSTSESLETIDLAGAGLYTHVWFGGIGLDKETLVANDPFGNPELVVVVYFRFGGFGKEAAPVAAQMIKKWREIKATHSAL